jgi:hypothetical protein
MGCAQASVRAARGDDTGSLRIALGACARWDARPTSDGLYARQVLAGVVQPSLRPRVVGIAARPAAADVTAPSLATGACAVAGACTITCDASAPCRGARPTNQPAAACGAAEPGSVQQPAAALSAGATGPPTAPPSPPPPSAAPGSCAAACGRCGGWQHTSRREERAGGRDQHGVRAGECACRAW